ncbi:Fic family protein [Methylocapsa sp. S129]|uniref:Fic family protein n=1 Tax=Methylocapsa sp. S129 TaxID=1641869 RepID=UPI00131E1127|nr:Fic family protein [Methylocapsa sp. S129]
MPESADPRRESRAIEPDLIRDDLARAEAEARNGLRQYDAGVAISQSALEQGSFKLRLSTVLTLQREALAGISLFAGNFRPGPVEISHSKHRPPEAHLVPELVEQMCDYVNDNWAHSTAIHLAAYVMWRLNWIHPFADGNGRTSRIVSYVVLTVRSGFMLPGYPTIPDQIVSDRRGYFDALDRADAAWRNNDTVDVSAMEELLGGMLARQLAAFYESAGGKMA